MLWAVADSADREQLKAKVLNNRPWTEAILFAVERASRAGADRKAACSASIISALEVDPILAAEMIFRATEDVWMQIGATVRNFVDRWHVPGEPDRAVRFMITTGRSEFLDLLWPLLSHENDQIQLRTLRAADLFRPTVLGQKAAEKIVALSPKIRKNILHQIAMNSGIDGLDLATEIAKIDESPEVKADVVDALSFRRADRHIADVLSNADDATFDILIKSGHVDDISDEGVRIGLEAARRRLESFDRPAGQRLLALITSRENSQIDKKVELLVAEMDLDIEEGATRHLFEEANRLYPQGFANGIIRRIRAGREIFSGADNILATAGLSLEDEDLLGIVLMTSELRDGPADAAASALGPQAVGKLLNAYLEASADLRRAGDTYRKALSDSVFSLGRRIGHTPGASLVAAVQARADNIVDDELEDLADLLSRENDGEGARGRPFNEECIDAIRAFAQDWGERLLKSEKASRREKAAIAKLIGHAPSVALLPILKRLLDDNLSRYRCFRCAAEASRWRDRDAVSEAQQPHFYQYQHAFTAIRAPETDSMMVEYLTDKDFGEAAAMVLAAHWSDVNEPRVEGGFFRRVDFSRVEARRAARAEDSTASSWAGDMIFDAIDQLIANGATTEQQRRAVSLGTVGARLPHGERTETIAKLLALAHREARAGLLLSLALSGKELEIDRVKEGIAETLEAAKQEPWILQQSEGYQLRDWLRLLPFAKPLSEVPDIVCALPVCWRDPRMLGELLRGLRYGPAKEAETVLFKLAENDARFYRDDQWRLTALQFGTLYSVRYLIDLFIGGALGGRSGVDWGWRRELAGLMSNHPELRLSVREILKKNPINEELARLAEVVSESPQLEDLFILVQLEIKSSRSFVKRYTVEMAITERIPVEGWVNTYRTLPIPCAELRRKLLALVGNGSAEDPAVRCLTRIDEIRDMYGAPEAEPRHPDLGSGRLWPILEAPTASELI